MKLELSVAGEISGNTGIMAAVLGTAFVPANTVAYFGAPTTGIYLSGAEVEAERENGALLAMSANFWSRKGIPA